MDRPATGSLPGRQAHALEEVVADVVHWRRVAVRAVAAAERAEAEAGRCLARVSSSVAAAVNAGGGTEGSLQVVVGEMDRARREAEEAEVGVRFRAEGIELSTRYVHQTVVRWRGRGGRPLQLAELGNAAAGQAAPRLGGCQSRCRTVTDRVQPAAAMEEALVANAAEREALAGARQAWARGASHLDALQASARVEAVGDAAWLRTQRAVTRLNDQKEALRRFDQPPDRLR